MNPLPAPRLIDSCGVAALLGRFTESGEPNVKWLYGNRELLNTMGFPGTVAGGAMGERYDRRAIELWLDALMPAQLRALDTSSGEQPEQARDDHHRQILSERTAQLASGDNK